MMIVTSRRSCEIVALQGVSLTLWISDNSSYVYQLVVALKFWIWYNQLARDWRIYNENTVGQGTTQYTHYWPKWLSDT